MKLGDKRIFDINTNISNLVLKFLINYSNFKDYTIDNISTCSNYIEGYIYYNNKIINSNYMDNNIAEYTNYLAINLSNFINKNIFFDIILGKIYIYI